MRRLRQRRLNIVDNVRERNESAVSFDWLVRATGLVPGSELVVVTDTWQRVRDRMRKPVDQTFTFGHDWISDPWVVCGVEPTSMRHIAPSWNPPDALDEWPAFDAASVVEAIALEPQRTCHRSFRELLEAPRSDRPDIDGDLPGDMTLPQFEQLRAWLLLAVGPLIGQLVLSRGVDEDELVRATMWQLVRPFDRDLPPQWAPANEYGEKHLDVIYNQASTPDGDLAFLDETNIRIGQGEPWREAWESLSRPIAPDELHEAIRLTARAMRCAPVLVGLLQAMRLTQTELPTVALCVLRRWLLTLKVMTWLEASVRQAWTHVRPCDLACFAFNAVKPDWPRRILAVSHRSADVKPELRTMQLWRSSRCAIDATYVPSWETNIGMVWGLFAAAPAIVRVRSPGYDASTWCLREAELIQHLVERLDFHAQRWVFDVDVSDVRALDHAVSLWQTGDEPANPLASVLPEFPPMCEVFAPSAMPAWEVKLWRAAAALRAINLATRWDAERANLVVEGLLDGTGDGTIPVPTNNPEGWVEYVAIFHELRALLGKATPEPELRLPSGYGAEDHALDLELLERMPDMRSGAPALADVLVALEFLRTEWPIVVAEQRVRFLAVDCREVRREAFTNDEEWSLHRGLLALAAPVPVWIIQSAGQHVDEWGLANDRPIFTQHEPHQFGWMWSFHVDRRAAQSRYPENSGLELSPELQRLCLDSG